MFDIPGVSEGLVKTLFLFLGMATFAVLLAFAKSIIDASAKWFFNRRSAGEGEDSRRKTDKDIENIYTILRGQQELLTEVKNVNASLCRLIERHTDMEERHMTVIQHDSFRLSQIHERVVNFGVGGPTPRGG